MLSTFLIMIHLLASSLSVVSTDTFDLVILHTNDVHARFEMLTSRGARCQDASGKKCFGGVARRAELIKEVKDKNSNVLVLDAGDQFQGTPWFFTYKGRAASHFLNKLHYDAMCLGNHEFDNGVAGLKEFLSNVTIPILCSNLIMDDQVPDFIKKKVKKHMVVEIGGRTVGVIGYITEQAPSLTKTENLRFESEEEGIQKEVELLKKQSVNIIIALGHAGLGTDLKLAAKLADVDVIVGGHSHSLLFNGETGSNDAVAGVYPMVKVHADGRKTLVVQAGSFGKYVGKLSTKFDEEGNLESWSGNPVLVDYKIAEDPEIKAEIDDLNKDVTETFSKVVGSARMGFDTGDNVCRIKECKMGNLYADAMMEYMGINEQWNADMALVNGGSFRASLLKGDITYGDAISVFPFNNDIVIVSLKGALLREVMEHSVEDFDIQQDRSGKFLQISGIEVKYDFSKESGQRVEYIKVKSGKTGEFEDVDNEKTYRAVLPSYLSTGGDGYKIFETLQDQILNIDILDIDVFLAYLQTHSPIQACIDGRINGMESFPGWSKLFPQTDIGGCSFAPKLGSSYSAVQLVVTFLVRKFGGLVL